MGARCSLLCRSQQQRFMVWAFNPLTVRVNVHSCCLDGKKMLILHLRAVEPHELRQADEIFDIVARVAAACGDLGSDLHVRGRPEIDGIVGGSDVDEGQQGTLSLLLRDKLHHLCYVSPQHNLSHVQIFKGLFNLGVCHFIGDTPCASLQGEQIKRMDRIR